MTARDTDVIIPGAGRAGLLATLCVKMAKAAGAMLLSALAFIGLAASTARAQEILLSRAPDRGQMILDGARKEGQVVLYSAAIVNQALRPLAEAFMKTYPFMKMTFWRGDTEEIVAKLSAEARAKNLVADLVEGTGVGELAVNAGLTQPYYSPLAEAMPERYRDPRGQWTSTRISYFGLAYNTKLVPPDQAPKTYDDLLDPRWRGKLAWRIGTASGTPLFITTIRLARGEQKAAEFFRQLSAQKVVNFGSGSARTLVDRVIAGEFPIALNIFAHHPLISRAKGAPVDSRLLDPVPSTAGTMVVPKDVRHPYAALLLADFILSKEAQQILANAEYFPARADVPPKDVLASVIPARAGVPELFLSPDRLNQYTESSQKIFEELFQ
jgi:ABC-type Fe3+ transport system substrate-binding protein